MDSQKPFSAKPTTNSAEVLDSDEAPRDAKIIALILQSMGVEEYQPQVINQLLEFMHRYTTDVFQDATLYSAHGGKEQIDLEDVRLAIQSRVNYSFTQPPPRELLLELAQRKNSQPLPLIPKRHGVRLPPEELCLTATNYQIDKHGKDGATPAAASKQRSASAAAAVAASVSSSAGNPNDEDTSALETMLPKRTDEKL